MSGMMSIIIIESPVLSARQEITPHRVRILVAANLAGGVQSELS